MINIPRLEIQGENLFDVPQFMSFTQVASLNSFSDSFTLVVGDPESRLAFDVIDCENVVTSFVSGIQDQFRISEMTISENPRLITVNGVSLESELALNEAEPKHYSKATDNQIIEELLEGFTLELDEAVTLQEFDVKIGEKRADAASRAARQNGFFLFVTNNVVKKTKIVESGASVRTYSQDQIMNINIRKSTSETRSKVIVYSSDRKQTQIQHEESLSPISIFTGLPIVVDRVMRIRTNGKDIGELKETVQDNLYKVQPKETVTFDIKGRDDVQLNQIVTINFEKYKLNLDMVVNSKTFRLSKDGEEITTLTLGGLGRSIK